MQVRPIRARKNRSHRDSSEEARWDGVFSRLASGAISLGDTYFKFLVFNDTTWDFRDFDFDRDTARVLALDDGLLAAEPDVSRFADSGGKLMLMHGWKRPVHHSQVQYRLLQQRR